MEGGFNSQGVPVPRSRLQRFHYFKIRAPLHRKQSLFHHFICSQRTSLNPLASQYSFPLFIQLYGYVLKQQRCEPLPQDGWELETAPKSTNTSISVRPHYILESLIPLRYFVYRVQSSISVRCCKFERSTSASHTYKRLDAIKIVARNNFVNFKCLSFGLYPFIDTDGKAMSQASMHKWVLFDPHVMATSKNTPGGICNLPFWA